jgi:hypothetical protein
MTESLTAADVNAEIERVLIGGDLGKLTPNQRLAYYRNLCQALGLNPLTKPFDYIVLQGKLTLYVNRGGTDQLRKLHGVSINNLRAEQIAELYVVVATAADRDGRTDSASGVVPTVHPMRIKDFDGKWKDNPRGGKQLDGEELAGAMMKAETKAKRRVTLSLCGLGVLDEMSTEPIATDALPPLPREPAPDRPFSYNKPNLICSPLNVQEREKKTDKSKFLAVKLNGECEGQRLAFVWDARLFDAVRLSADVPAQFEVDLTDGYPIIIDVMEVNGIEYRNGVPYEDPLDSVVITDDDIPF